MRKKFVPKNQPAAIWNILSMHEKVWKKIVKIYLTISLKFELKQLFSTHSRLKENSIWSKNDKMSMKENIWKAINWNEWIISRWNDRSLFLNQIEYAPNLHQSKINMFSTANLRKISKKNRFFHIFRSI